MKKAFQCYCQMSGKKQRLHRLSAAVVRRGNEAGPSCSRRCSGMPRKQQQQHLAQRMEQTAVTIFLSVLLQQQRLLLLLSLLVLLVSECRVSMLLVFLPKMVGVC